MSRDNRLGFEEFARETAGEGKPGWSPYPWQLRFAERWAAAEGEPPDWVVAPTGAGKTLAIDALLWALAQQAELPPGERTVPTRIVWAIDRRILVDEVHEHAQALAGRLNDALDAGGADPLHDVALRLYRLACADPDAQPPPREERARQGVSPLAVQRWRGGLSNREQLLSPFQPQVITSTVAQIGSRLLFRGYGVGERSLQVAAGLAAVDTVVCLDEAHLALPFHETVTAIRRHRAKGELQLPPLRLLTLTATPPEGIEDGAAIELQESDHARLGKRWSGEKTVELRAEAAKPEKALASAVAELLDEGRQVLACVVNRVRTAQSVHQALAKSLAKDATVALLIGPQRPADRERELARIRGVLFDGDAPERPVVVVATQTIEVGLDADFDAMVTQSASAAALVQRLGRLNRSGDRPGRCIVVRDTKSPLYEQDEPPAWAWLEGRPGAPAAIDASVAAIAGDASRPPDLSPPLAPTLTEAIARQLSQTSPPPAPLADPEVEPFLKGIGAEPSGDVRIVWRRDLRFAIDEEAAERAELTAYREALLTLAPPEPREALTQPIGVARRTLGAWLADPEEAERKRPPGDDGPDLDGAEPSAEGAWQSPELAAFVVVRGRQIRPGAIERVEQSEQGEAIALGEILPGDTIVVPTSLRRRGGRAVRGPRPCSEDAMADQEPPPAELAGESARFALRFSWDALAPGVSPASAAEGRPHPSPDDWLAIARGLNRLSASQRDSQPFTIETMLASLDASVEALPSAIRLWLERLAEDGVRLRLRRVTAKPPKELEEDEEPEAEVEADEAERKAGEPRIDFLRRTEPVFDQAWVLTRARAREESGDENPAPPTLGAHCLAVRARVSRFGSWLGLPKAQQEALELAALAHDAGKLDPRIQGFLAGGSAAPGSEPLAKSRFGTENPAAARASRGRAGMPYGLRHEALSVAILAAALEAGTIPPDLGGADPSLALALVGGHHGFGSPLWPVEEGGLPAVELSAELLGISATVTGTNGAAWLRGEWLQQFFDLRQRLGHWDMAYLQALLAVADRTVSREGR